MEMGKTIGKSIRPPHLWILQFWEFFCQPFGKNTFAEKCTQNETEQLQTYKVFKAIKLQLGQGKHLSARFSPAPTKRESGPIVRESAKHHFPGDSISQDFEPPKGVSEPGHLIIYIT